MNAYASCQSARARLIDPAAGQSLLDYPWSSLISGYAVPGSKRPKWLDVSPRLALSPWADSVAGRRSYVAWLDGRAREEKAETLGVPESELKDQGLRTTLQRGWYWGSESFKEWLQAKLAPAPKGRRATTRTVKDSAQGKDHAEKQAREILALGCRRLGLEPGKSLSGKNPRGDLRRFAAICGDLRRFAPICGDLRRVAIAWAIWRATAMPQRWIAEQLGLRSAANVSQWLRRFEAMNLIELPKEIREWKREMSEIFA